MRQLKLKYGFFTTYEETIFLKQEKHPTKKGKWVLWHSPVILHSTRSRQVNPMYNQGVETCRTLCCIAIWSL